MRRVFIACLLAVGILTTTAASQVAVHDHQKEWEEYLAEVASETPEEAIEQLGGAFPSTAHQHLQLRMRRGEPFATAQELLADDPRMRSLRRAFGRAEPDRHEELMAALTARLEQVLEARQQLDAVPEPGETPSGIPLILLAAQYDRTGAALPVLLAWYEAETLEDGGIVDGSDVHYIPAAVEAILQRLDAVDDNPHDASRSIRARTLQDIPMSRRREIMNTLRERLQPQPE